MFLKCRVFHFVLLVVLQFCVAGFCQAETSLQPVEQPERWILIDSASATLQVMRGDTALYRFGDISLGRLGVKPLHFVGDTSTPSGDYRIISINHNSDYTLFLQLNYPTLDHAKKALHLGRISQAQFGQIEQAQLEGKVPPQDTPLGGMIGIHGIGRGSLAVHRKYNWTEGCVALDNQQIRALAKSVRIGMRVVIQ